MLNACQPLPDFFITYPPTFTHAPGPGGDHFTLEEAVGSPRRLDSRNHPQERLGKVGAARPTAVPPVIHVVTVHPVRQSLTRATLLDMHSEALRLFVAGPDEFSAHWFALSVCVYLYQTGLLMCKLTLP